MSNIPTEITSNTLIQLANNDFSFKIPNQAEQNFIDQWVNVIVNDEHNTYPHLRGKPLATYSVVFNAVQWRLLPSYVAQNTCEINKKIFYQSQVIKGILANARVFEGHFLPFVEWVGPWENLRGKAIEKTSSKGNKYYAKGWKEEDEVGCGVTLTATFRNAPQPTSKTWWLSNVKQRHSTDWAQNPEEQLERFALRHFVNLFCPVILGGVYFTGDVAPTVIKEKDITPAKETINNDLINQINRKTNEQLNGSIDGEPNESIDSQIKKTELLPIIDKNTPLIKEIKDDIKSCFSIEQLDKYVEDMAPTIKLFPQSLRDELKKLVKVKQYELKKG